MASSKNHPIKSATPNGQEALAVTQISCGDGKNSIAELRAIQKQKRKAA